MAIIQNYIEDKLRQVHKSLSSFSPPWGLHSDGELDTIPAGVDLRLSGSKKLNLVLEGGGGNIILYQCEIDSLVAKPGTFIYLFDCKIKKKLELYGTEGVIEGSTVDDTDTKGATISLTSPFIKIENKSSIEFMRVNFRHMKKILEAKDSKLIFQECRNRTELVNCMTLTSCSLKISRCKFYSRLICIETFRNSTVDVMSSHIRGYKGFGISCSATRLTISDCQALTGADGFIPAEPPYEAKGIMGAGAVIRASGGSIVHVKDSNLLGPGPGDKLHDYGIEIDLASKAEFTSTSGTNSITGGGFEGIKASGFGTSVNVINYSLIDSKAMPGITCEDQATVYVHSADTIFSDALEAIRVTDGGSVTLDLVKTIEGKTEGVTLTDESSLVVTGRTNLIKGISSDGIKASSDCSLSLTDVVLVQGLTNGISTDDNCQVSLFGVKEVSGLTNDGLTMTGGGKLLYKNSGFKSSSTASGKIKGQVDGIKLSGGGAGVIIGLSTVEGQDGDAISIEEGSKATIRNIGTITGLLNGIYMDQSSRITVKDIETIQGSTNYGLLGEEDCAVQIEDVTLIKGGLGGIRMASACDYLHVRNVTNIEGTNESGIYFDGKGISLRYIALVTSTAGDGNGIEIRGATGIIDDITKVLGNQSGLVVKNSDTSGLRSVIKATRIPHCEGVNSPHGLDVIISQFTGTDITFIKDGLAANAQVDLSRCAFGGAFVSDQSALKFSGCSVNGHFQINETSFDILNTTMTGEHISTNSAGTSLNYTQTANYTATNEGAVHTNLTLGAALAILQSSMTLDKGSVSGTATFIDSTVEAKNVALTGKVTVVDSTYTGKTSSHPGGIDTPNSSVMLHKCTSGAVTTNGTALGVFSGEAGSILVTNSSVEVYSAEAIINGLHKPALESHAGYVVVGGSGKRYVAFDDEVREWYNKSYKFRVNENYQLNVGNVGGTIEISGKDGITVATHGELQMEGAGVCTNEFVDTARPREPEVIG